MELPPFNPTTPAIRRNRRGWKLSIPQPAPGSYALELEFNGTGESLSLAQGVELSASEESRMADIDLRSQLTVFSVNAKAQDVTPGTAFQFQFRTPDGTWSPIQLGQIGQPLTLGSPRPYLDLNLEIGGLYTKVLEGVRSDQEVMLELGTRIELSMHPDSPTLQPGECPIVLFDEVKGPHR
jgi:hypothetical protein